VGMNRRRWALVVGVVATTLLGWAVVVEPSSLRVRTQAIALPQWPAACDGLRVVVLADLHVGSPFHGLSKLDQIVARVGQQEPDLILLAGDYVIHGVLGGRFVSPEDIAASLGALSAPMGVWAVLGNHDWWLDAPRVTRALTSAGVTVLEDASTEIIGPTCRFWLAGISDYWEGAHDIRQALQSVPDEAPIVAFTHNPDLFPEVPPRVTLTVAGHTHGGQVAFPFVGAPIVPSQFGQRYASGLVVEDGRQLFVSPGLGTSILPVRFRVPPEISVLTLQAR
jgi:predicted MPP superfamily phosphohydrolase